MSMGCEYAAPDLRCLRGNTWIWISRCLAWRRCLRSGQRCRSWCRGGRNGADRSACVRCERALGHALSGRSCVPLFGRGVFAVAVWRAWWGVPLLSQSRAAGARRLSRRTYALGLPPPRRPEGQSPRPRHPRLQAVLVKSQSRLWMSRYLWLLGCCTRLPIIDVRNL